MANDRTKAASGKRKAGAKPTVKRSKNAAADDLASRRQEAIAEKTEAGEPLDGTDAEVDIDLIIKKNRILDLRVRGATIRQISQRLSEDGMTGVSKSNVQKLLRAALDDAIADNKLSAKQLLQLELEKLDRQELALFPNLLQIADADRKLLAKLSNGTADSRTIQSVISKLGSDHVEKYSRSYERTLKLRLQLLGIAKPIKVDINPQHALAQLLGRKPEELPRGDLNS